MRKLNFLWCPLVPVKPAHLLDVTKSSSRNTCRDGMWQWSPLKDSFHSDVLPPMTPSDRSLLSRWPRDTNRREREFPHAIRRVWRIAKKTQQRGDRAAHTHACTHTEETRPGEQKCQSCVRFWQQIYKHRLDPESLNPQLTAKLGLLKLQLKQTWPKNFVLLRKNLSVNKPGTSIFILKLTN